LRRNYKKSAQLGAGKEEKDKLLFRIAELQKKLPAAAPGAQTAP